MRLRLFSTILLAIFVSGAVFPAFGWHEEGHKLTGYIAWQRMTPQTREAVVKILRAAPEDSNIAAFYPVYGIEPEELRKMNYFILIPTWADMVRERSFPVRNQKYHHSNWHYYDTFWSEVDGKIVVVPAPEETGQAVQQLEEAERVMKDPKAKDADKAVAIAWMLHLTGDLHQPLHNSARVTKTEPKGDQGGNLFLLTPEGTPPAQRLNLHTYWDGITNRSVPLPKDQCLEDYLSELGTKMMKKHPYEQFAANLRLGQYRAWHAEGFALATTVVFTPELKRFEMPSEKYQKTAFATAERQIALAGYRIAETLNGIFGTPAAAPVIPN
jgi:hypothetical protein